MNSKFEFPMKIVATYRPSVSRSFGIQQIHELLAIEWFITIGYESRLSIRELCVTLIHE